MSGNKIFAQDNINTGRQPEVDIAKVIVILSLASIYVFVECTSEEGLSSGIPYFFDSVLGIYFLVSKLLPDRVINAISRMSKNVTEVYFIQWVLVWWAVDFFTFIIKGDVLIAPIPALILGLILNIISVILADVWIMRIVRQRFRRSVMRNEDQKLSWT
ncbi:MAG: hypothetical protein K6F79_09690 [Saccharofermentans sp.]|nr:hypothetical protein [Saccharofermentans sp.]